MLVLVVGTGATATLAGAFSSTYYSGIVGVDVFVATGVGATAVFGGYCGELVEGIGDGPVVFAAVVAAGAVLVELGEVAVFVAGAGLEVLAAL